MHSATVLLYYAFVCVVICIYKPYYPSNHSLLLMLIRAACFALRLCRRRRCHNLLLVMARVPRSALWCRSSWLKSCVLLFGVARHGSILTLCLELAVAVSRTSSFRCEHISMIFFRHINSFGKWTLLDCVISPCKSAGVWQLVRSDTFDELPP